MSAEKIMTSDEARGFLRAAGLRCTAPRVAVLCVLASSEGPLSHSEVLERIGESPWDQATVYRNLVKLRRSGLAPVVSRAGGIDRYVFARTETDLHRHPHFICDYCGRVECLPGEFAPLPNVDGGWAESVRSATVEFRGACPDCRNHEARSEPG